MPVCPSDSEDEETTPSSASNRSFFNICGYGTNSSTTSEVASIESEGSRKSASPAIADNSNVNRLCHCEKHGPYAASPEDGVPCCRGCLNEQQSILSLPDELKVETFLDVLVADKEKSDVSRRLSITDVTLHDHTRRNSSTQMGLNATVERLKQIQIDRSRSGECDGVDLSTPTPIQGPTPTRIPSQNTQTSVIRHQGRRFKIVPASTNSISDLTKASENPDQKESVVDRRKAEHHKGLVPSKPPAIDIISPSPTLSLMSDSFSKPTLAPIGYGFGYLTPKTITPISLSSCSSSLGTSSPLSPISTSSRSEDGASPLPPLVRTPKLRRRDLLPPIHPRDWGKLSSPSSDSDRSSRYPFSSRTPSDHGSDTHILVRTPEVGSGGSSHSPKSETEMNLQHELLDASKRQAKVFQKDASPLSDNKFYCKTGDNSKAHEKHGSELTFQSSYSHQPGNNSCSDGETRKTSKHLQLQHSSPMTIPASSVNVPSRRISLNFSQKSSKYEPTTKSPTRRDSNTHKPVSCQIYQTSPSAYRNSNEGISCHESARRDSKYSGSTFAEVNNPIGKYSTSPIHKASSIKPGMSRKTSMKSYPVSFPHGPERENTRKNSKQSSPLKMSTVHCLASSPPKGDMNSAKKTSLSISPKAISDWKDFVPKFNQPRRKVSTAKPHPSFDLRTSTESTGQRYHLERDDSVDSLSVVPPSPTENFQLQSSEAPLRGLRRKGVISKASNADVFLPSIQPSEVSDRTLGFTSAYKRDQYDSVPGQSSKHDGGRKHSRISEKMKGPRRRITIDSPCDLASMRRRIGQPGERDETKDAKTTDKKAKNNSWSLV